jgi:hypothetical protein
MRECCGMATRVLLRAGYSHLLCASLVVTPQKLSCPAEFCTTLG